MFVPICSKEPPKIVSPSQAQSTENPMNFATAAPTKIGIIVAERKERKRAEPGKFDKQGVAPYTDGDNT